MTGADHARSPDDPFELGRFVRAQESDYDQALSEIRSGHKRTHWMWYMFPQIAGLGRSPTAQHYAITGAGEARAYLDHPILGPRLLECAEAVMRVQGKSATQILGAPDDMKLKSCATLFACVSPPGSVFERLLEKYFAGTRDVATLRLLAMSVKEADR